MNGTYTEIPPAPPASAGAARRRGRGGRLTVSSPLAKLTVAPQFMTLRFNSASVEQGKEVDLGVKIDRAKAFPGAATVTLLGLPNQVTAQPVAITSDSTEMVFHVKTGTASPAGQIKNLFCRVVITQNGQPITHNLGTGKLRIDKPLPSRTAQVQGKPAHPATAAGGVASSRPFSRLEKLRLESKARTKPPEPH